METVFRHYSCCLKNNFFAITLYVFFVVLQQNLSILLKIMSVLKKKLHFEIHVQVTLFCHADIIFGNLIKKETGFVISCFNGLYTHNNVRIFLFQELNFYFSKAFIFIHMLF